MTHDTASCWWYWVYCTRCLFVTFAYFISFNVNLISILIMFLVQLNHNVLKLKVDGNQNRTISFIFTVLFFSLPTFQFYFARMPCTQKYLKKLTSTYENVSKLLQVNSTGPANANLNLHHSSFWRPWNYYSDLINL